MYGEKCTGNAFFRSSPCCCPGCRRSVLAHRLSVSDGHIPTLCCLWTLYHRLRGVDTSSGSPFLLDTPGDLTLLSCSHLSLLRRADPYTRARGSHKWIIWTISSTHWPCCSSSNDCSMCNRTVHASRGMDDSLLGGRVVQEADSRKLVHRSEARWWTIARMILLRQGNPCDGRRAASRCTQTICLRIQWCNGFSPQSCRTH